LNPPEGFFSSCSDSSPKASAVAQTSHSKKTFKQLKLRQQLETYTRDGILTVLSIAYAFRPQLRIASPWVECRCPGNLEFSVDRVFTCLSATYANILTSSCSTDFHKSASARLERSSTTPHLKNVKFVSSVYSLAPLNFRHKRTGLVSYYAFFKGWLLLSQPPSCMSPNTTFAT
jgi:hypothetical protein